MVGFVGCYSMLKGTSVVVRAFMYFFIVTKSNFIASCGRPKTVVFSHSNFPQVASYGCHIKTAEPIRLVSIQVVVAQL